MKRLQSLNSGSFRWIGLLVGVAAVAAGASLTLKPFDSLDALTLFIAASLILAGIGELLSSRDDPDPLTERALGLVLVVTGLVALALRGETIRTIGVAVGIGLVIGGLARFSSVLRGRTDERYANAVGGLAGVVFGVLALSWPDVTILVIALLVGPAAVILGLGQIWRAVRGRTPADEEVLPKRPSRLGRWFHIARATAALLVALALIAVSAFLHDGSLEVGAFYDTPSDMPSTPGALLRSDSFDRDIPDNAVATRILYTTTDNDGKIKAASAVVITPEAATSPVPVILWNHGTTGVARKCAPSILDNGFEAGAFFLLSTAIDQGWAVIAPDYTGLGGEGPHPYLVGRPTAYSALDSVRAAHQLDGQLSDQTVVWGHSQGGGAALWVGQVSAAYAPDVPLLGIAALAPASDAAGLIASLQGNRAGMLFSTLMVKGYSDTYPDVKFDDYVRSSASKVVEESVDRCLAEPAMLVSLASVLSGDDVFAVDLLSGPLGVRLAENSPSAPTGIPTLIGQGLADGLVIPDAQAQFVSSLCAAGQVVDYRAYAGRDHVPLVQTDSPLVPDLVAWTTARFNQEPDITTCTTTER